MKHWAIFYNLQNGSFVEPLGSFHIIRIDARLSRCNMEATAAQTCKARGYQGFRIARGNRLDRLFFLNAAVKAV